MALLQPQNVDLTKTIWITKKTKPFEESYTVDNLLGEPGQFGITFQCRRKSDGKSFAVKKLDKSKFYRIPQQKRHLYLLAMKDEIEILSTLVHPYIIKFYEVYEDKGWLYLVMEACVGGELLSRIVSKGHYSENDAARIIKQLLEALQYMHERNNIVHCDLKPENILFLHEGEDSPIKIIDFGLSKVLPKLQYLTHLVGTPYYTAPEVINGEGYNHACDCWSVGVILFVIIFGYPPFYVDANKYSAKKESDAIFQQILGGFLPVIRDTNVYGYGPWFPSHIAVSDEVRDLISKLLTREVKQRYAAVDALTHPWIQQASKSIPKAMIKSLAKFSGRCALKSVVVKLFREQFQQMRPKHFSLLAKNFVKLDTDKDGIITYEDFIQAMGNLKIERERIKELFEGFSGKDHGLCFTDLLDAAVHDYLVSCDERLYAAFRELDEDDDGLITTEQLKTKLQEIDPEGVAQAIDTIEKHSLTGNGQIEYGEFLARLHPHYEDKVEWIGSLYKVISVEEKEDN